VTISAPQCAFATRASFCDILMFTTSKMCAHKFIHTPRGGFGGSDPASAQRSDAVLPFPDSPRSKDRRPAHSIMKKSTVDGVLDDMHAGEVHEKHTRCLKRAICSAGYAATFYTAAESFLLESCYRQSRLRIRKQELSRVAWHIAFPQNPVHCRHSN
jgi:hypothetical protein